MPCRQEWIRDESGRGWISQEGKIGTEREKERRTNHGQGGGNSLAVWEGGSSSLEDLPEASRPWKWGRKVLGGRPRWVCSSLSPSMGGIFFFSFFQGENLNEITLG